MNQGPVNPGLFVVCNTIFPPMTDFFRCAASPTGAEMVLKAVAFPTILTVRPVRKVRDIRLG
jgi:hypothetical protein